VRLKHCRKVLAKELPENPWVMAELEKERQQALHLCPLIATIGDLGGGNAHRRGALEEVMRTNGEDMQAKMTQKHCVMCGMKASATCQACHMPSEGVVAKFYGPYTSRGCIAPHMVGVPSRCRRGMSRGRPHICPGPCDWMSEA